MALMNFLKSTVLSKVVMAVTGIVLVLFIIGHTLGNMQVYLGPEAYNKYAAFLQGLGEILWIIRGVLLLCIVLHIITSIRLKLLNLSAKPTKYQVKNYVKAKLSTRTMIWTGSMVAAFLIYHLLHFTAGVTNPEYKTMNEVIASGEQVMINQAMGGMRSEARYVPTNDIAIVEVRHDVYKMVITGFRDPAISIAYIIGVILLGFHLVHAIQSAFQTLGMNHARYFPIIMKASTAIGVVIVLMLISLPITIMFRLVGGAI